MVRKLAFGSALTAAVLPTWALALGLGDIDLHSHLNQPLQAEIPLVAAHADELGTLRVTLASQAEFARAGLDWQHSLRNLRFSVEQVNGQPVIRVTTQDDFREPYLSFLIEVNWNRGRILREYTLLVDPPVFAGARSTTAAAPPVRQSAAAAQAAPAPVPQRRSVAAAPRGLPPASQTPTEYGPTQRRDTLWTIAEQVRPHPSVTIEQTMMALQRLNPDAFIDENVNQLKAGHVLKVPDLAEIERMSAAAARAEFRRQTRIWRAGDTPAAPAPVAAAAEAEPAGRLTLLAPEGAEDGAGDQAAGGGAGAGGGAAADAIAAEEADAAIRQENAELRERIAELQQQLEQLQTVAQLKDDQLAALQQQLRALGAEGAGAEPLPDEAAPAPEQTAAAEDTAAADAPSVQYSAPVPATPATDQPVNPYAVEGFQPVDLTTLPTDVPEQPFKDFEAPAPEVAAEAAPAAPAAAEAEPAPAAPASLLDRALAALDGTLAYARTNPLYAAGAGAVLVLLILAALVARQRRRAAAGFGESILQETRKGEAEALAAAAAGGVAAAAADGVESEDKSSESSYLSDFGVSGMDSNIESEISEADPLTEADVFLAYGRFQPAENMIREAIENEPERLDLKAKLLEIHYAARDRDAFEREAQMFHSLVEDHSDAAWQKVAEMGRELCPDNPLFRDDEPAPAAPAPETEAVQPVAEDAPEPGLDDGADLAPAAESETSAPEAEDNLIDFDLGELEAATAATPEQATPAEAGGGLEFDIDMDFDTDETAAAGEGLSGLADELSELSETLEAATGEEAAAPAEEDVAEFDLDELGVDLDEIEQHPAAAGAEAEDEAAEEASAVSSAEDEVGTKLDLARAYIDMGDPDGAKSILDEVLEEGSEGQKHEAEQLLQQIS